MIIKKKFIIFLLAFNLFSCSSTQSENEEVSKPVVKPETKVHTMVNVNNSSGLDTSVNVRNKTGVNTSVNVNGQPEVKSPVTIAKQPEINTSVNVNKKLVVNNVKQTGNNLIIYNTEKYHHFSTLGKKDFFSLTLTGNSIQKGDLVFKIISSTGKLIYNQKFKGEDLIGYGLSEKWQNGITPTPKEYDDYILKRMKEFFDEKNFFKPAIAKNEKPDLNFTYQNIWDDIKSDNTAIGFHYLIGKEDNRWIAWSKKQGKVLQYKSCC
jgi:hypothetical protein